MQKVALYGNSLILSSIGATLKGRPGFELVVVDPDAAGAVEMIDGVQPDVIVFDSTTVEPDSAIALWQALPHVLLIGVDLRTDKAHLLSGQSFLLSSADDLVQAIESHALAEERGMRLKRIAADSRGGSQAAILPEHRMGSEYPTKTGNRRST